MDQDFVLAIHTYIHHSVSRYTKCSENHQVVLVQGFLGFRLLFHLMMCLKPSWLDTWKPGWLSQHEIWKKKILQRSVPIWCSIRSAISWLQKLPASMRQEHMNLLQTCQSASCGKWSQYNPVSPQRLAVHGVFQIIHTCLGPKMTPKTTAVPGCS